MRKLLFSLLLTAGCATSLRAQDKLTIPFSSTTKPRKLQINLPRGNITIRAYEGQEVVVESNGFVSRARNGRKDPPPGMHRIEGDADPHVSEQNNTVKIDPGWLSGGGNITVQVPAQTSVNATTMSGTIHVENISGEIEVNSMNGLVEVTNASGPVVAHSMNGRVQVSLSNVMPDKAMSFSTMNGDIDVSLPASIKANVRLRTNRGSMFTDFDFQTTRDTRSNKDQTTVGAINGGGPEIQFITFNGDIVIHKK